MCLVKRQKTKKLMLVWDCSVVTQFLQYARGQQEMFGVDLVKHCKGIQIFLIMDQECPKLVVALANGITKSRTEVPI